MSNNGSIHNFFEAILKGKGQVKISMVGFNIFPVIMRQNYILGSYNNFKFFYDGAKAHTIYSNNLQYVSVVWSNTVDRS